MDLLEEWKFLFPISAVFRSPLLLWSPSTKPIFFHYLDELFEQKGEVAKFVSDELEKLYLLEDFLLGAHYLDLSYCIEIFMLKCLLLLLPYQTEQVAEEDLHHRASYKVLKKY
ncbi:hypothetical protein G4B88_007180 [Cannabis sativa]|uniref:Uncharacterized protein n=1 Tax=Cannabis sativa TaxID=3483 RepID=A0A7J6E4S2_CANSA|nr:hypothetical protein G4B88_007180 [Cannabis sativa]